MNSMLKDGLAGIVIAGSAFLAGCSPASPIHIDAGRGHDLAYIGIPIERKAIEPEDVKDLWKKVIDSEGVLITPRLLAKYPAHADIEEFNNSRLSEEKITHLNKLLKIIFDDNKRFTERSVPENYTERIFLERYDTIQKFNTFIQPSRVAEILGVDEKNQFYLELKARLFEDDNKKVPEILYCATLLVHRKLKCEEKMEDIGSDLFLDNLREGKGDCSDYSFAVANTYYRLCEMLGRSDLSDRIRVTLGMFVEKGKPGARHAWIDYQWQEGGKREWKMAEVANSDFIDENSNVNLSHILFYVYDSDKVFLIPTMSMRNRLNGKSYEQSYYAHILPVIEK